MYTRCIKRVACLRTLNHIDMVSRFKGTPERCNGVIYIELVYVIEFFFSNVFSVFDRNPASFSAMDNYRFERFGLIVYSCKVCKF